MSFVTEIPVRRGQSIPPLVVSDGQKSYAGRSCRRRTVRPLESGIVASELAHRRNDNHNSRILAESKGFNLVGITS